MWLRSQHLHRIRRIRSQSSLTLSKDTLGYPKSCLKKETKQRRQIKAKQINEADKGKVTNGHI